MGVFSSGGVGIDLGSANLTICLENEGIVLREPSYVLTLREDLEDIIATLHVKGMSVSDLDAIGVAVPGIVNKGSVAFSGFSGYGDYELGRKIAERYGVKVYVDNNANAAAVGCYVSQSEYDSVTLHTQQVGAMVGGQGTVCNGHLLRGRRGMAGELSGLNWQVFLNAERFADMDLGPETHEELMRYYEEEASWSGEAMLGMFEGPSGGRCHPSRFAKARRGFFSGD